MKFRDNSGRRNFVHLIVKYYKPTFIHLLQLFLSKHQASFFFAVPGQVVLLIEFWNAELGINGVISDENPILFLDSIFISDNDRDARLISLTCTHITEFKENMISLFDISSKTFYKISPCCVAAPVISDIDLEIFVLENNFVALRLFYISGNKKWWASIYEKLARFYIILVFSISIFSSKWVIAKL